MAARVHTALTEQKLSVDQAQAFVADPAAGAVVVFTGTVREHAEGRRVAGMSYEAYESVANERLAGLAADLARREGLRAVWLEHRVGELEIGEPSVVVAVSGQHRPEAFAACRDGIDRLKGEIPIWKHEHWAEGGAHWPGTD